MQEEYFPRQFLQKKEKAIRKQEIKEAKSVTIAPAQKGVMVQADPGVFKKNLLGRAVIKGDLVALGGTRSRRKAMMGSPFEDIFNDFLGPSFMGGFVPELKENQKKIKIW